jgi:hypothetical protein
MAKHGKTEKWAARGERLSAALRENLKRRKDQARARRRALGQDIDQGVGQDANRDAGRETDQAAPEVPEFRRNPVGE